MIKIKTIVKVMQIFDINNCYDHSFFRNITENIDDQSGIVILSDRVQSVGRSHQPILLTFKRLFPIVADSPTDFCYHFHYSRGANGFNVKRKKKLDAILHKQMKSIWLLQGLKNLINPFEFTLLPINNCSLINRVVD